MTTDRSMPTHHPDGDWDYITYGADVELPPNDHSNHDPDMPTPYVPLIDRRGNDLHCQNADDDQAVCPTCWTPIHISLLCEHDDPDTGPLCTNRCCGFWHDDKDAA